MGTGLSSTLIIGTVLFAMLTAAKIEYGRKQTIAVVLGMPFSESRRENGPKVVLKCFTKIE